MCELGKMFYRQYMVIDIVVTLLICNIKRNWVIPPVWLCQTKHCYRSWLTCIVCCVLLNYELDAQTSLK